MLKCLECGHLFEVGEEKTYTEYMGECHGASAYETFKVCPVCGGDFEETKACAICGAEHFEDDLQGGVCADCLTDVTLDDCLAVNGNEREPININSVLVTLFSRSEIEEILMREIREAMKFKKISLDNFINIDKSWFAEELAKVRKGVK